MKKIIILDFDGTLANTAPVIINTFHRVFGSLKMRQHTDEEIASTIGLPLIEAFPVLSPMTKDDAEKCAQLYRKIFEQVNGEIGVPLFPHVSTTLRHLHSMGYILTIATSRGYDSVSAFIKSFGLDDIITYIIAAENVKHAKPNAEPVITTLSHFSLVPDDAVVVGDTHFDILMGRNAGCMTVGVTYGNGSRQSLADAHANAIIDDFAELSEILMRPID